jgi:hypothetical protein
MGASSSISTLYENTYISYPIDDANAENLQEELLNSGYKIENAHFLKECNYPVHDYQLKVETIMAQSKNILICVSEKTITSFRQAIEINFALDSNKKIIYAFTDEQFTPINTPYLNGLVSNNIWLPAYDESTIIDAIEILESYNIL